MNRRIVTLVVAGALSACSGTTDKESDRTGASEAPPTTAGATVDAAAPSTLPPVQVPTPTTATLVTSVDATSTTDLPALTTSPLSTQAEAGAVVALDVLAFVTVVNERQEGYDRDRFGYPSDADGNGCDTRAEVLIEEGINLHIGTAGGGCNIAGGQWAPAYDGVTSDDPTSLEVDHVVALKEAHDSGAWAWDTARLTAFANDLEDPRTLRVATAAVNGAKGDADPSNWLPPDGAFVCQYLADWISIKVRWGLSMDQSEHGRIGNLLTEQCPGQLIAPWPDTPPAPPPTTLPPETQPPAPTPPPVIQPAVPLPQQPSGECDPSYPTVCIPPSPPDLDCGDISFRRFQVLPADPHRFDGDDDDGVGCESG